MEYIRERAGRTESEVKEPTCMNSKEREKVRERGISNCESVLARVYRRARSGKHVACRCRRRRLLCRSSPAQPQGATPRQRLWLRLRICRFRCCIAFLALFSVQARGHRASPKVHPAFVNDISDLYGAWAEGASEGKASPAQLAETPTTRAVHQGMRAAGGTSAATAQAAGACCRSRRG